MAAITALSDEDLQLLFAQDAVLYFEDPGIGEHVKRMEKDGFPIESAQGLEFCEQNVFKDTRVLQVLNAIFPGVRVGLGIYEVYRPDPDHIYAFMTGLQTDMKVVVIELWSPQSSLVVFDGSQLLPIKGFPASNGLLEIPLAPLKQADCKEVEFEIEKGGLIIHDARLSFRRLKGFAIHFVFATEDELKEWSKKKFPRELKTKAAVMETPTMGLNFAFDQ